MEVKLLDYTDNWQKVKNCAMNTIGKEEGGYPSSAWKTKILLAEHSPIRQLKFTIRFYDLPYWVSVHFVRHKVGVEHYVSTQRTDRTGKAERGSQSALVTHTMDINAQAMIAISRKRLCYKASPETRQAWEKAVLAFSILEPELMSVCVPECVYRGMCPEMQSCGRNVAEWRGEYEQLRSMD